MPSKESRIGGEKEQKERTRQWIAREWEIAFSSRSSRRSSHKDGTQSRKVELKAGENGERTFLTEKKCKTTHRGSIRGGLHTLRRGVKACVLQWADMNSTGGGGGGGVGGGGGGRVCQITFAFVNNGSIQKEKGRKKALVRNGGEKTEAGRF